MNSYSSAVVGGSSLQNCSAASELPEKPQVWEDGRSAEQAEAPAPCRQLSRMRFAGIVFT
jgi:hypothetical protein